jgi:hypothetical protein
LLLLLLLLLLPLRRNAAVHRCEAAKEARTPRAHATGKVPRASTRYGAPHRQQPARARVSVPSARGGCSGCCRHCCRCRWRRLCAHGEQTSCRLPMPWRLHHAAEQATQSARSVSVTAPAQRVASSIHPQQGSVQESKNEFEHAQQPEWRCFGDAAPAARANAPSQLARHAAHRRHVVRSLSAAHGGQLARARVPAASAAKPRAAATDSSDADLEMSEHLAVCSLPAAARLRLRYADAVALQLHLRQETRPIAMLLLPHRLERGARCASG